MISDLTSVVERDLLPTLAPLGFRIVSSEVWDSFDNANVVLESALLRIRVVRERSSLLADFGPVSEPNTWFDSTVVADYLGISHDAGFHGRDAHLVLRGLGAFVRSFHTELATAFDPACLRDTKRELEALKGRRAAEQFGG